MKKSILLIILIAALAWSYRYSLISPFVNTSQEKAFASDFNQYCVADVPDLQKIESLAIALAWNPILDEGILAKLKTNPTASVKAWVMSDGLWLTISTDTIPTRGPQAMCSLVGQSISSEIILLLLSKSIKFGSPYRDEALSHTMKVRGWDADVGGNTIAIALAVSNTKNTFLKDEFIMLTASKTVR